MCELRFKLGKLIFPDGTKNIVTKTRFIEQLSEHFSDLKRFNGCKLEEVNLTNEEIKIAMDKYIALISKYYKEKQIILIKNYPVQKHLDERNHEIFRYPAPYIFDMKTKLEKWYNYFKTKLPNINVVEMPENTLGSAQHLWGKDSLHFVDKYYEYLFKAIKIITKSKYEHSEELNNLKEHYANYFELLERQKQLEYCLCSLLPSSLLTNSKLEVDDKSSVYDWSLNLAPDATYDTNSHLLACGGRTNNWAILNHEISQADFAGKTLTFSVKYKTYDSSMLNIAFVSQNNGERQYIAMKQAHNNKDDVESISFKVPNKAEDSSFNILVYLNQPNQKATIYETKLEYGEKSTFM